MANNMFEDGWYLVDLETAGIDPLRDDIIAVRIAYMVNYKIKDEKAYYIKPREPLSPKLEELTGLTNTMLDSGVQLDSVVEELQSLKAPLVFFYEDCAKFLNVAWRICGKSFDMAYLALDGLAAIVFGYSLRSRETDLWELISGRRIDRAPIKDPDLAQLYDLTLAIFQELQDRYDVRAPGQFDRLYEAEGLDSY